MCIRLVVLPRLVWTAKLFMNIVRVKLETLKEDLCIPTLSGRLGTLGGDKTGTKQTRMIGLIIQMVGEDMKFGWLMFPTLIATGPSKETHNLPEG